MNCHWIIIINILINNDTNIIFFEGTNAPLLSMNIILIIEGVIAPLLSIGMILIIEYKIQYFLKIEMHHSYQWI